MANLTNSSKLIEKIESLEPIEYNAGEGIEIINGSDYSAMRGPAPEGFHVPLLAEWQGVKTIMDGLSLTTGDSWRINLHIPFAGFRGFSDSSTISQGYRANLWYSSTDRVYARNLNLDSSRANVDDSSRRADGLPVRCFKDSYVAPDSNWTVIQGTLGSTGIFWNQSEGLISITDGTTGYTMMDKNLGATTVYNDGDTLSEANCGKYYQRGNSYGFPRTGSVTTSSTQIDASGYGPTNPYLSDIFITGNNDWSSVQNDDLWGGTTGPVTMNNAITNTGVLSVNGQTGNVTVASPDMSNYLAKDNTTSFTPTGDYNPATKKYVDDNAGAEYNSGQGISIRDTTNSRKGPSPDGFHVPSIFEWDGLVTIMESLSLTTGNDLRVNLHMPFVGCRDGYNTDLTFQGSRGCYWSSSPDEPNSPEYSYYLLIDSSNVLAGQWTRTVGFSIRAFKDSYIAPDSNWIVIQGTLGSTGIFWNQSEGLISITDGTTGYTIMDKNLGATTVYSDGDTLTQANMGNMYQWGNNYGFPSTGTISKTSSTQVDASSYGPTNPYSSDTFITGTGDWSSVHNNDLWGDTTGTETAENVITNTGVLSVNGQTGNVTIQTSSYTASTGISISNNAISIDTTVVPRISTQANNVFSSGLFIWGGTQTAYEALGTYDNNTLYFTVDSTGMTLQSTGAASLMSSSNLKGTAQLTSQTKDDSELTESEPVITEEEIADDILDSALDAVDDEEVSTAVTPDEANPESVEHMDEVLDIANDAVFTS